MNHKAVYRTAPATPGLLKTLQEKLKNTFFHSLPEINLFEIICDISEVKL